MQQEKVIIQSGPDTLYGNLNIPDKAQGIVLFAHGSGSSRFSPRNNYVATALNEAGLATMLFDLLTKKEENVDQYTREFRFDIALLSRRLSGATDWVQQQDNTKGFVIGYFGSSTGAAAALCAAVNHPKTVKAIVSRGGRPDLAGAELPKVQSPTLLIVGGLDETVIELNKQAKQQMQAMTTIAIVPGATHLFEEPGTLDQVIELAKQWFNANLQ